MRVSSIDTAWGIYQVEVVRRVKVKVSGALIEDMSNIILFWGLKESQSRLIYMYVYM